MDDEEDPKEELLEPETWSEMNEPLQEKAEETDVVDEEEGES